MLVVLEQLILMECQARNNKDIRLPQPAVLLVERVLFTVRSQLLLREAVLVVELRLPRVPLSRVTLLVRLELHKLFRWTVLPRVFACKALYDVFHIHYLNIKLSVGQGTLLLDLVFFASVMSTVTCLHLFVCH